MDRKGNAIENPWSGRLHEREILAGSSNVSRKGKEKVYDAPRLANLSAGYDDVDGNSNWSIVMKSLGYHM